MKTKTKIKENLTAFEQLSIKHQNFVMQYLRHFGNAAKAYRASYPSAKNSTSYVQASRLLTNPNVKQAIDDEYAKIYANIQSDTEKTKTYELIKAVADAEISDVVDLEKGTLLVKDLKDIPPSVLHSIQSIKYTKNESEGETHSSSNENIEVKLHPKMKALEMRAKIQKLLDPDKEIAQLEIVIKPAERPATETIKKPWDEKDAK